MDVQLLADLANREVTLLEPHDGSLGDRSKSVHAGQFVDEDLTQTIAEGFVFVSTAKVLKGKNRDSR